MPKTLTRRTSPAPEIVVREIKPADHTQVSVDDRKALREWLTLPTTKLALSLVESQKPSIMRAGVSGSVEDRRYAKETRLTQLQGWESYRNALLLLEHTPQAVQAFVEESYPDQP